MIPEFLERRIRQPVPQGAGVVPGSTPVVSFGGFAKARVATLGFNPSKREFLDRNGNELTGRKRRFHTLTSLSVSDLESAPDDAVVSALGRCERYFEQEGNPYLSWFKQLSPILEQVGVSYFDGSACHLDLVQWATDPVWARLGTRRQRLLLDLDTPFLLKQLLYADVRHVLANGQGVIDAIKSRGLGEVRLVFEEHEIAYNATRIYAGRLGSTHLVGWSPNIQSGMGVTHAQRQFIAKTVGAVFVGGPHALTQR